MNAPLIHDITTAEPTLDFIPLDNIRVSPLHVQTLRRQRFSPEALLELAASIKSIGVAQPIVVRPVPVDGTVRFEIVAGERRWIAADRAGLGHIPAIIRELTDGQVLEIQLVENLQREGLHPLEEGAGYKELMDLKHTDAETIGAMVGKSRSYVYSRVKLLDLCPAAREALQSGTLDASKALLIARLGGDKLQRKALERLNNSAISYAHALSVLRNDFMVPLATAPFAQSDATLTTKQHDPLPACATCPSRSGNDIELCNALDGEENVCTDKPCFDIKTRAHWHRVRIDAIAAGHYVIAGDKAAALAPDRYGGPVKNGFLNLDASPGAYDFSDAAAEGTFRTLLGSKLPITTLVEGKGGMLHELLPVADAIKALKAAGHTPPKHWSASPQKPLFNDPAATAKQAAERAREEEHEKVEHEYRTRLFAEIWKKWKGPFKRPDLERLADQMRDYNGHADALDGLVPDGWRIDKATDADLLRYIACLLIVEDVEELYNKPGQLLEAAQRFKIDHKKIRAQVVADLKPVQVVPAAADTGKPKPAAKKKAAKK